MLEPEVEASPEGASGTLRFDLALMQEDPKLGTPPGSWPEVLAGEIRWSCGPWFAPDASVAPTLEDAYLPGRSEIIAAVRATLATQQ